MWSQAGLLDEDMAWCMHLKWGSSSGYSTPTLPHLNAGKPGPDAAFDASGHHLGSMCLPAIPAHCAWGRPDSWTMLSTARASVDARRMKTPAPAYPGPPSICQDTHRRAAAYTAVLR